MISEFQPGVKNIPARNEINIDNEVSVNIKNKAQKEIKRLPICLKKNILKLVKDVTVTFSVLLSLQLQFYGFLILYEKFEMRRNNMLLIY